MLGLFFESSDL